MHKTAACTVCNGIRELRHLTEGLCGWCNKRKAKSIVGTPTSRLSAAALKQLSQENQLGPDDNISVVGVKRTHQAKELQPLPENEKADYDIGGSSAAIDHIEEQQEVFLPPPPKRSKANSEQPQQKMKVLVDSDSFIGSLNPDREIMLVAHTDYQVINLLKELENSDRAEQIRAQELQEICHMLSQETIFNFLTETKGSRLVDIMLLVQGRAHDLSYQQSIGLVMGSIALGGACWQSAVKMLSSQASSKKEDVLLLLKPCLRKVFSFELVEWLHVYWKVADQTQLDLMHELSHSSTGTDYNVMMLSLVTTVTDQKTFVRFSSAFAKTTPRCIDLILSSISQYPKQQKVSFEELLGLTSILQLSDHSDTISNINEKLLVCHVNQWRELIVTEIAAAKVIDCSSVQAFLDELQLAYGEINQFGVDATQLFQEFQILLSEVPCRPKDRQSGLAQYCIGRLYGGTQRQLWVVPSGQGKSFIIVSFAVLALLSGAVTKIHIVFTSRHLMRRDIEAFRPYFLMLGYDESRVEYHLGCDFKPNEGELIIIDEVDVLMFKDPLKFNETINGCLVVGFTATPDNFKSAGAERRIINLLQFQKFHYMLEQKDQKEPNLAVDEVVSCNSVSAKAEFIHKQAEIGPVLVYCKNDLTEALEALKCSPILITDDTEPKELQELDKILESGKYKILVAENEIPMRGFDYRSLNCQMSLILARSFQNDREVIQGLGRVGRWGDQCKRIKFSDVNLVDQEAQLISSGVLIRAASQLQQKPVQLKKIQVKKPPTTKPTAGPKYKNVSARQVQAANQPSVAGFFAKQ